MNIRKLMFCRLVLNKNKLVKSGVLKRQEWKMQDHEKYGGGKCKTGKRGTKWQGWKRQDHRLWNAKHHVIYIFCNMK